MAAIRTNLNNGKLGIGPSTKSVLFKDIARKFLDTYAIKKRSFARDLGAYQGHLKGNFGNVPMPDIKIERIERYLVSRKAEISRRKERDLRGNHQPRNCAIKDNA